MTLQQTYIREYGEERWKKLSPRLKKLFVRIDSNNEDRKPVSPKQLKKALS